ncbi:MAG: cyclic nucleotide-binding domain-containing protein [Rhodothermales bacterium]|nr:cyclic nucleotide-binding domain-containing protein [Rhodothermales bacterium]
MSKEPRSTATIKVDAPKNLFDDRWSGFGNQSGIKRFSNQLSSAELMKLDLFKDFDAPALDAIAHDISVATWEQGAILFEEGSYLDLAFYVLSGRVEVYIDKLRRDTARPIFNSTVLTGSENVAPATAAPMPQPGHNRPITFLSNMDVDIPRGESMSLGAGEIFGEIGSLNGWPQSATARVAQEATLIQIRLPALRELKKRSDTFKATLDALYRERALMSQLVNTPLFEQVDRAFMQRLAGRVELVSLSPGDRFMEEGAPVHAVYMVRSGFIQLGQTIGEREATVTYLSKGMTLGEIELLLDGIDTALFSATSVGYSELVRIDRGDLRELLETEPTVTRQLWEAAVQRIQDTGYTRKRPDKAALIEFALEKGLVQGNSMLVIDLEVCTRCDDCVEGCASTHGGRPRFVREGDTYGNFMIARSCYHCEDPVCLIGCPTGAIRRTNVAEVVAIDDDLCIGCGNCANKCPYDAIVMHDTGTTWPDSATPAWLRGRDRKVASKCDLCHTSDAGPACVNSCPHSCAFRIGSLDDFQTLLASTDVHLQVAAR